MLLSPFKALVRLVCVLPVLLRPGVFIAIAFTLLWLVFVKPRVPALYHAGCRSVARVVDVLVGLVLLPEYALTTSRRRRGHSPAAPTLVVGHIADPILSGAHGVFERHEGTRLSLNVVPWKLVGLIVAVCAGAWIVMDKVTPTSPTRHYLTVAFQYWRDVEAWGDVNPARRAASGGWYPPPPIVRGTRRHPDGMHVALNCLASQTCNGTVVLAASSRILASQVVKLKPHTGVIISLPIPKLEAHTHARLRVVVNHL